MAEKFPQPQKEGTPDEAITENESTPQELRRKLRKLIESLPE